MGDVLATEPTPYRTQAAGHRRVVDGGVSGTAGVRRRPLRFCDLRCKLAYFKCGRVHCAILIFKDIGP